MFPEVKIEFSSPFISLVGSGSYKIQDDKVRKTLCLLVPAIIKSHEYCLVEAMPIEACWYSVPAHASHPKRSLRLNNLLSYTWRIQMGIEITLVQIHCIPAE